jgi:hypothetical protein
MQLHLIHSIGVRQEVINLLQVVFQQEPIMLRLQTAQNCTQNISVANYDPPCLTARINTTDVKCFGTATGSAIAHATGGSGTFNYYWQPVGINSPCYRGLNAGVYSVVVTDAKGCTATIQTQFMNHNRILIHVTTTPAGCLQHNGSAIANVAGGIQPYSYLWNPGCIQNSNRNRNSGGFLFCFCD